MLYKNDAPYKLMPQEIKALKEKFHDKWPVLIIYPPERVTAPKSKQNTRADKPNSIAFPLTALVKTETGTDTWRYAEHVIIKEHGIKKYTPRHFRYNGRFPLNKEDIELLWFLYEKSPYCKGGKNQGRTIKFMFEDKITEADLEAAKTQRRTRISALIHDPDFGLSEDKLRIIAKALFIKGVDKLTYSQVKLAVEHHILRGKEDGYEKFASMIKMDELVKTRVIIQEVIDSGFLKFDATKKEWLWIEEGMKTKSLCRARPQTSAEDTIYDFYMGNKEFQDTVDLVSKTLKKE